MRTNAPLVSIVVPVYNGAPYLWASLGSIVAQTYPNVEVLVMDDASTDATPGIVASFGSRVRHHRQERNRGQFDNVNDGIARARGSYVAVFHADDLYDPRIVEKEVDFLERHPEAGAVFAQDVFIDPSGRPFGRLRLPADVPPGRPLDYPQLLNALLRHMNRFLRTPGGMVRASVYRDIGPYRPEFGTSADLQMWVRIARRYPIAILGEHLFRYRTGHGNASGTYNHVRTEPDTSFEILDSCLVEGGRGLASAAALRDYEAHRAEDGLMCAISAYIRGDLDKARLRLRAVRPTRLLASRQVQRGRLLALLAALHLLARLPILPPLATLFYRRWHTKHPAAASTAGTS